MSIKGKARKREGALREVLPLGPKEEGGNFNPRRAEQAEGWGTNPVKQKRRKTAKQ